MKQIFTLLAVATMSMITIENVSAADANHHTDATVSVDATAEPEEILEDIIYAHSTNTYIKFCRAGIETRIRVIGDGDTDLEVYIYDENNNLVMSDANAKDDGSYVWTPNCSAIYTIKIHNLGDVYNRCTIYS